MREAYPRWGERKLAVLLRREGHSVVHSTVGLHTDVVAAYKQGNSSAAEHFLCHEMAM